MWKVMIVDDDSMVYRVVKKSIDWEAYGMSVEAYAPNGEKAIEYLKAQEADILFVDLSMPHMGGLELIRRVYEYLPKTVFIILSSHSEYRFVKESFCTGAFDYLLKVDVDDEEVVDALLTRTQDKIRNLQNERERRFDLGELVSKINLKEGGKEEYFYQVQVLKFEETANRLQIGEKLFELSGKINMAYGCYEGCLIILYYGKEETEIENGRALIAGQQLHGIEREGISSMGPYQKIEQLCREAGRNMDDGFIKIKNYLLQHYSDPDLSLQMVSEELNMGKREVGRRILEYSGLMFKPYLNQIRIQAAKEKLERTNMRIQEVAYACGYMNVEHFTRTFTEKVGCSPSKYSFGEGK